MISRAFIASLVIALMVLINPARSAEHATSEPAVTITVHADRPGVKVSPTLYGIFFEEINRAAEGGLYAEMVQNRSFEDSTELSPWTFIKNNDADGGISIDTTQPLNPKNARSLRLESKRGRVGAANGGFAGMAVRSRQEYVLSLYARGGDGFAGPINVTLENSIGRALASGKIENVSSQWQRFSCALKAGDTDTDPTARLVIAIDTPGTVWLDVVSLMPKETWKGRGLRPDIAQMVADMKPAFFRFPGGCWVEGETLGHSYHWKQTIGDIAQRQNNYNLWKYYCTNGMGFHEYLQFCEDIGAEPLFVINCGMSHKQTVPINEMDPWVQDALDAIDYANGAPDSKWGGERAKNGHPAPFNLKYMEIGNENGGAEYNDRYALFYDAIKKHHPEVRLVADFWRGAAPNSRPVEVLDEHYYNNPGFFISNADRYDRYDRSGPKIYVGEYAVTRECGGGNLRAAVAEAAFMTGLERNSDVVAMASYAPLLCNVHYKIWNPNAINFDSTRVFGTPSYYAQQMFARNRADVVLPADVQLATQPQTPHGAVGIGTWNTQAEFKDIKVTRPDQRLLACDFTSDASLSNWKKLGGDWKVQDGAVRQTTEQESAFLVVGDPSWSDYTISLKARKLGGREGFLIRFNSTGDDDYTMWNIGGFRNTRHVVEVSDGGAKAHVGRPVTASIEPGRWYDIRVELRGDHIRCFLDDKVIHDVTYGPRTPIYGVAGRAGDDIVVKLVNVSPQPQDVLLRLAGCEVQPTAKMTVLTSQNPLDENSFDAPTKVAPIEQELTASGADLRHEFPANSIIVLRLKTR